MIVKRYANRKLYDSETRQYVTLEDIAAAIRRGEEVQVIDHASGADLTTLTLAQVIFEQEKKLGSLLPQTLLTRLIQVGDSAVQNLRDNISAFLDPVQHAEDEMKTRLQTLVDEGLLAAEEGQRLGNLLLAARRPADVPPDAASLEEFQALLAQVEQLETELQALRQSRPPAA